MPRIDETLDKLGEAKFLSKIDLAKGFYQIQVEPRDIPKTAFVMLFGKFEFLRMPFGLRNAPASFQRAMENILSELYELSSPYIDDVVIYSHTWEDHLIHIDRVLKALTEHGLTIKPLKCVWAAQQIEYLGFVIGNGELSIPTARMESI